MDEVLKRLGSLETIVTDVRLQLASVTTILPTFATKADQLATKLELKEDIRAVNEKLAGVTAVLPTLASKEELQTVRTEVQGVRTEVQVVRTEMQAVRTEVQAVRADVQAQLSGLLKWIVGTGIASAGVAAAVASAISRFF